MIQKNPAGFSCFLVGNDTLLIECGNRLLDGGHEIRGVITDSHRIEAWADSHALKVHPASQSYQAALESRPYDYLFSITFLRIIPEAALQTPAKGAINFHDGPLPRYAGLHAPAWALIHRESEYGITWHQMTQEADTGEILEQLEFSLAGDETSLSLNTRCFAAALDSFATVIERLEDGTLRGQPQDLTQRTYFSRHQKPHGLGCLDFVRNTAADLEALVRALHFGPYENPLATAKWVTPLGAVNVVSATAHNDPDGESSERPGQVLAISETEILVGTAEGLLAISSTTTPVGRPIPLTAAAAELGLKLGQSAPALPAHDWEALNSNAEAISRSEVFWRRRLARFQPVGPPFQSGGITPATDSVRCELTVPEAFSRAYPGRNGLVAGVVAWLGRTTAQQELMVPIRGLTKTPPGARCAFSEHALLQARVDPSEPLQPLHAQVDREIERLAEHTAWPLDLISRDPELASRPEFQNGRWNAFEIVLDSEASASVPASGPALAIILGPQAEAGSIKLEARLLERTGAETLAASLAHFLESLARDASVGDADLLGPTLRDRVLNEWNETDRATPGPQTIGASFQAQVDRTPDRRAVIFEGDSLTYSELDQRANALAHHLARSGVGVGDLVGLHIERSLDLPIALLAVLKLGAAYVPLDPAYPRDRITFMIEDSGLQTILTRREEIHALPTTQGIEVIRVDQYRDSVIDAPASGPRPEDLCYLIYTSGSTGQPKGVMVEHRHVINFFHGMDEIVPAAQSKTPGVWFSVTSLSFDISVLEMLWTLARGFEVVIHLDRQMLHPTDLTTGPESARHIDFGLFYWGNDDGAGRQKYRLLLEGARFADQNGFNAVWTPERHFHAFGGPYPNPAITGAAVAATTQNLEIRAGSCVLPLHDPIRVAEEWAVLDNLSNGRVAIGIASGWQPNDFVLAPQNFKDNKSITTEYIETLRKLWRGEEITRPGPLGDDVPVSTQPRPVQPELPLWVTTAGNPETYRAAARSQANVLTHLLGQSLEEVGDKISLYRQTLKEEGLDPDNFKVTLMLHTFVGEDTDAVRELVRAPMKEYLGSSVNLVKGFAWSFPAFKKPEGLGARAEDIDLDLLSPEELDAILDHAFERYFDSSGLFGDVDQCVEMIERCKQIGVDEIACLIDYGVPTNAVLESLPRLKQVLDRAQAISVAARRQSALAEKHSLPQQFRRYGVTHLQATPSMIRMLLEEQDNRDALFELDQILVGGEAMPPSLAAELGRGLKGSVTNMYGPTETTIWSSTHLVDPDDPVVPIGRPIANTKLYVLDGQQQPLPPGLAGELYIGGQGVVRGYWNRPELTAERFIPNPFSSMPGARLYKTGDLVRFRSDGLLEFLGRTDHQVKIRGHRIELGEIEARLMANPAVRSCVVVVREDMPGDHKICAYWVPGAEAAANSALLREHLRETLPEYMIPAHVIEISDLPLTPNRKIDRNALPKPDAASQRAQQAYLPPSNEIEKILVDLWKELLGLDKVGIQDNFFDLGGHSLLVVQLHRLLKAAIDRPVPLTDLYRFTTIQALSNHLTSGESRSEDPQATTDRAKRRRDALQKRRRRRS